MANYITKYSVSHIKRLRSDNAIKASAVLDSSRQKTLAESVRNMVEADLEGNCHTADTGAFLNSILPVADE